ncbi:MAG: DUF3237 family protein [Galactobacter sp.]
MTTNPSFTLTVDLAVPVEAGDVPGGTRRIMPIAGGRVDGRVVERNAVPRSAPPRFASTDRYRDPQGGRGTLSRHGSACVRRRGPAYQR